ncbi:MAG: hypothetical protein AAFW68_08840 [Pseudomonadota bacterium]
MKKLLCAAAAAFAISAPASAEHWDVIAFEMTGKCDFAKYMEIVDDFNVWGADYGYVAKVAMPLQSDNLTTYFWVGSSADAAAFGAAWDAWRDGLADSNSTPSKLWVRFEECSTNMQRRSYDVFD